MNQVLKDRVYAMGNQQQVDFMKKISGMDSEEEQIFQMMHEKKTDDFIIDTLNLTRKSYDRIIESMRAKLLLGVFYCINQTMDNERV